MRSLRMRGPGSEFTDERALPSLRLALRACRQDTSLHSQQGGRSS